MKMPNVETVADPAWWTVINAGWFSLGIGTLIGLISLYVAYFTYVRTKSRPSVMVTADSSLIVGPVEKVGTGDLQILYNNVAVAQVTSAVIGLWNDGTTIFRKADIVEKDHLRIFVQNGIVLHYEIESVSREVIGVSIQVVEDSVAKISFEFFEPDDAVVIRLLHTGTPADIAVSGTIIGLPQGLRNFRVVRPKGFFRRNSDSLTFVSFGAFILGLTALIWIKGGWQKGLLVPAVIAVLIAVLAGFIALMEKIDSRWKARLPKPILSNNQLRRRLELQKLFHKI